MSSRKTIAMERISQSCKNDRALDLALEIKGALWEVGSCRMIISGYESLQMEAIFE